MPPPRSRRCVPAGSVLHVAQHRAREKGFLADHGFPVTPFAWIRSEADLDGALRDRRHAGRAEDGELRLRRQGPGRRSSQMTICGAPGTRWAAARPCSSGSSTFDREVSVVVARGVDRVGDHVTASSRTRTRTTSSTSRSCPRRSRREVEARAAEIARGVAESLDVVGVLCVEFFLTPDGELLINELAPRPHNSGHLTIDASMTSQFEQQVRAICGLPPGSTELLRPAAMANLLGDLWAERRARLGRRLRAAGRQAAPVRQGHGAARPEDGPPHGARAVAARSTTARGSRTGGAHGCSGLTALAPLARGLGPWRRQGALAPRVRRAEL